MSDLAATVDTGPVTGVATPAGAESLSPFVQRISGLLEQDSAARASLPGETPEAPPLAPAAPETPPPAEPAAQPAESTVSPKVANLLAAAKEHGVDLTGKYKDDESALQGLLHAAKMVGERDQYSQLGKALAGNPQAVFQKLVEQHPEWLPQQRAPEPSATAPESPVHANGDLNLAWFEHMGFKEGTPENVKREVAQYFENQKLQRSPVYQSLQQELNAVKQQLGQVANRPQEVQQYTDQQINDIRHQMLVSDVIQRNAKDWLRFDDAGNVVGYTPLGFKVNNALQEAFDGGIRDLELGLRYANAVVGQQKTAPAPPPAQTPGLTHRPNSAASPAAQLESFAYDPNKSFYENTLAVNAMLKAS